MITKFIEATNGPTANYGKFLLARFDAYEWARRSAIPAIAALQTRSVLAAEGWTPDHVLVLDLATGEGALFKPHGHASADLNTKHQIWVCPLFEPFLNWLYTQNTANLQQLPDTIDLPDAPFDMRGHRRSRTP